MNIISVGKYVIDLTHVSAVFPESDSWYTVWVQGHTLNLHTMTMTRDEFIRQWKLTKGM